jgi:hypothetical protein
MTFTITVTQVRHKETEMQLTTGTAMLRRGQIHQKCHMEMKKEKKNGIKM